MPKGRYRIMTGYMPKVGQLGLDMMYRTCTVQTNLDFSSEADMVKKLRVSLALAAGRDRAVRQFAVHRRQAQRLPVVPLRDLARHRSPTAPACCRGRSSPAWAMSARSITRSTCRCISSSAATAISTSPGRSFRDSRWQASSPNCPASAPTVSDWANHLSTIFPEVRLKRYLEMRGADGGPWRRLPSLSAFWVGLLYDDASLDAAWDIVKHWTAQERQALRDDVPRLGFKATIRDRDLLELARETLALARAGLRGAGGSIPTAPTRRATSSRSTRSSSAATPRPRSCCAKFHGPWGGSVDPVFTEYAY